jgi:hypothetical protein
MLSLAYGMAPGSWLLVMSTAAADAAILLERVVDHCFIRTQVLASGYKCRESSKSWIPFRLIRPNQCNLHLESNDKNEVESGISVMAYVSRISSESSMKSLLLNE